METAYARKKMRRYAASKRQESNKVTDSVYKRTCTRCATTVETFSEIVYSQGSRVCLDCKKETQADDNVAFDHCMEYRR